MATYTRQVLVLNSAPTLLSSNVRGRRGIEIQNIGANAIYVGIGDTAAEAIAASVITRARRIQPGEFWSLALYSEIFVYARAAGADQTNDNGTIVTEIP